MPRLVAPVVDAGTISSMEQPQLRSDGLLLRPWHHDDAPVLVDAHRDPDIQRWHFRRFDDLDEAVRWIEATRTTWQAETSATWAVADSGRIVGRAKLTFHDLGDGLAEVSYWVVPRARRRGVASRSVAALAEWAFGDLGLHRLELDHSVLNPASCRVALRAGFEPEGVSRSALRHLDGWHDMHRHARINPDPHPNQVGVY